MSFIIQKPGFQTTLQDLGRFGYQQLGISVCGAMDLFAARTANLLLGNPENAPVLEMTMQGAVIDIAADAWICICGADMQAELNGARLPLWRPAAVKSGSRLQMHRAHLGMRAYLAVSGGFEADQMLGSASTDLKAGFGGFHGRVLHKGDQLALKPLERRMRKHWEEAFQAERDGASFASADWSLSPYSRPNYRDEPVIRFVRGREADWFADEAFHALTHSLFRVSPQSDRMGYRLEGTPLAVTEKREMLSEAVTAGTVQVPPSGQPIVLMADRQTTGGYPRIAQVIQADLPVLAQTQPGKRMGFVEVTFEEAESLLLEQEDVLQQLKWAAAERWKGGEG